MKVLHLPSNVAGNAFGLAQGERSLGLDSQTLCFTQTQYNFPSDIAIRARKNLLSHLYQRTKAFLQLRQSYDVYHFNFGATLIHYLNLGVNLIDLPFYNSDAVKVVSYQGCDARQKYPTMQRRANSFAACFNDNCYAGMCNSGTRDKRRRNAIDKMMQHCGHAFAVNPDLLHFLPKDKASFLPYTVPNFDKIPPKSVDFFSDDVINIVHAPTQREAKGTNYIIKAVEKVQEQYPGKVNLTLIEGVPYLDALKLYAQADLVIDQVLIGWYGGFAVEVMKMGIPVAAYINEEDLEFIPKDFANDLPIINMNPDNITKVLEDIIIDRDVLISKGRESQKFVEKWHNPQYVAGISSGIYQKLKT